MRLGIDLGTSRTVVVAADRGNYPVVQFRDKNDLWYPWYPSLICRERNELHYGFDAEKIWNEPSVFGLPSFKRLLGVTPPHQEVVLGGVDSVPLLDLLVGFCTGLQNALIQTSNLMPEEARLEVMIAVPANANSNQRYLTSEAFQRAGFSVLGMVNEPSAAGIEYTHQYLKLSRKKSQREYLVVYDWGAGTFDAAVIRIADLSHEVLANQGISRLGGDDLDETMLSLALHTSGLTRPASTYEQAMLLRECREAKERLRPQSKKIMLDFSMVYPDSEIISLPVAEYYKHTQPLVARTLEAMEQIMLDIVDGELSLQERQLKNLAAIYLVGGSSNFPQIEWCIREQYGRRIQKSSYPYASTAIGLAILADPHSGFELREKVSRHFGVWREGQSGGDKIFDLIFPKDRLQQNRGEMVRVVRSYRPSHNIGHFRFLECSSLDKDGQPQGNITVWEEIFFPFDSTQKERRRFSTEEVIRHEQYQSSLIEEVYICDANGIIQVEIINRTAGYGQIFALRPVTD